MSWITDLAGKAEDILNKIDKNAANVLQQPSKLDQEKAAKHGEVKAEESIVQGLKRNLSSSSLSLAKSLTPKKILKNDLNPKQPEDISVKSERLDNSNLSSRRSSVGSRADSSAIIELDTSTPENIIRIETKTNEYSIEKELAAIRIALAEVTIERNELKDEVFFLQEEVKQARGEGRIKELEILVNNLVSERDKMVEELSILQTSNKEYIKTISELETNLAKGRQSIFELTEKLNLQSNEAEQRFTELQQYRKKAQATLQAKDKLIEELKLNGVSEDVNDSNAEKLLQYELDGLRQENLHLNDEVKSLSNQLESSKSIIQQLQSKIAGITDDNLKNHESLKDALRAEQQRSSQLESEIKILNQEMAAVREEMNRQRQSLSARLHEKEMEITKLRTKASEIPGISDTNNLENRLQSLTQALVGKQAAIETVTAEKNALRLQLEKVEDQLRHIIAQNRQNQSQIINLNDTDDAKLQLPLLMRENPFDTNVARRVKRAYSSLDSAGIRVGVFLRRYPLVRIMVFIYVALLHLWVMFVLLSSTPT